MTDATGSFLCTFQLEQVKIENFPYDVAFHPHGIFLDRENQQLYVVNHAYAKGGERIDIFNVDSSADFEQVKRVSSSIPSYKHLLPLKHGFLM